MNAISIKMGIWLFVGSVSFFLLMYTMGLGYHKELRLFNGAIHLFCLYLAIQAYYKLHPENIGNYMMGVVQGLGTSVVGVGGFAVFMTIFLAMEPTFMSAIRENSNMGTYLSPVTASIFLLTEGLALGLIGSYILTRILDATVKNSIKVPEKAMKP